jgi:hypothetical protein
MEPFRKMSWNQRFTLIDPNIQFGNLMESSRRQKNKWYFVHDGKLQGHAYFMSCGGVPHYLGRNGKCLTKPSVEEQFPVDGRRMTFMSPLISPGMTFSTRNARTIEFRVEFFQVAYVSKMGLLTDEGFFQVDLEEETTKLLYPGEVVSAACVFKNSAEPDRRREKSLDDVIVLLRTADRVRVLDYDGKELESYLLPTELRNEKLRWCLLDNEALVIPDDYVSVYSAQGRSESTEHLFWINKLGEITRRENVVLKAAETNQISLVEKMSYSLILPSPIALLTVCFCDLHNSSVTGHQNTKSDSYWNALCATILEILPALLAVSVISIIFAILCYRRQQKFGLSGTWMWVGFVLLFGVPGYLGYRFHRVWPARLPCPSCGRRAPRDREACLVCGREFPSPAMKGIEVFA